MEKSSYNPEYETQLENVEFYKKWIKDTFDMESVNADILYDFHKKLAALKLTGTSPIFREFYGIDMSDFFAEREKLVSVIAMKLEEQLHEAAVDLQQNIFDANLFDVYVISMDRDRKRVEGVMVYDHNVVPVIAGEPYDIRNIASITF